jgi:putative membrane protein
MNLENHIKGTRLDKSSPFFLLINVIQKSIFPMVVGIYTYAKYSNGMQSTIIMVGTFLSLLSILQYWFYHYWIQEDTIEIKEGVVFKNHRKIPYSRIQNVNVLQNPLHRILKVATLQLESASGGKPEAVMRVVSLQTVEIIKEKVRDSSNILSSTNATEEIQDTSTFKKNVLLNLPISDVVKFGIISQKGSFYVAILIGFFSQYESLLSGWYLYINSILNLPNLKKLSLNEATVYILIFIIIAFVILQLLSILWSLMKFYDFSLEKNDHRLHASMGLLSKVSSTIPLKRIQLFRISENPIHKYFNAKTITIETAGGVNTDQQGIIMRWLAPYISSEKISRFTKSIEPKIQLDSIQWRRIPARAWKRVFKRQILILAITTIPFLILKNIYGILLLVLIPFAYLYAKNYILKTAYFINNDIICFKSGIWFGKQSFVKINRIQTIEIQQSYFDRRNNMATLEIDTAGSNIFLHHVKIPYLDLDEVYQIRDHLKRSLNNTEFSW